MASEPEYQRVLHLYVEELRKVTKDDVRCKCDACKAFRGAFARDWVRVATDAGLKVPGSELRTERRPEEDPNTWLEDRKVDGARVRLRQFVAGHRENRWVLVGIETTIADRNGRAYPPEAYTTQGRLL